MKNLISKLKQKFSTWNTLRKFRSGKITLADTDRSVSLRPWMIDIVEAIGFDYNSVFVSDLSTFDDFCLSIGELEAISSKLGIVVRGSDYLVDVAEKLRSM